MADLAAHPQLWPGVFAPPRGVHPGAHPASGAWPAVHGSPASPPSMAHPAGTPATGAGGAAHHHGRPAVGHRRGVFYKHPIDRVAAHEAAGHRKRGVFYKHPGAHPTPVGRSGAGGGFRHPARKGVG